MHTTERRRAGAAFDVVAAPARPHLDDAAVANLLDLESVIHTQEAAFADLATGDAASTLRSRAAAGGVMASAMAAVVPRLGVAGAKVYATHAGRFTFHVVLWDLAGHLLCTLDGDALTAIRTPAASAIAIRRLAAPGASVAALVGAGRQALGHAEMLAHVLPLTELRVSGRRPAQVEELVRHLRDREVPARAVDDPAAAVEGAEVVVTATAAAEPLFPAAAVSRQALICAVGATKADRCEVGPDSVARCAAVVVDSAEGSRAECGDLIRAAAADRFAWDRAVELAGVIAGTAHVPRAGEAGPVLFETQGVALQDVAAAGLAWSRYRRGHAGASFTPTPSDDREDT
ncbi:MAG TPA: hypothetical protein VF015_03105 [Acidimicrobiales bacterium]